MSNVRISNGSPTLERMEARQADYPKPSACRTLFGPVDREELARELQQHSRDLEEASRRRWNFDFYSYQPLGGRYEWQAVGQDTLPEFYSRPPRLSKALAKSASQKPHFGGLDVNGNCSSAGFIRSQGSSDEEDVLGPEQKTETAGPQMDLAGQSAGQRKRPASDDSFPQNKRANMTEEVISEDAPSASSVEQTPKKSSPRRCQT
ncbi:Cyclin-dependent kinase inhibitor 1B [Varanus komodoensis]|uniref:Cyclin-dependent kinase inhibitor 1B n=1 Tax=Varanus komodoensis TaxID=61221 RepID=A0A8D2JE63_VARKO|nr:cyclin-dependent kinase inhibitor 1B [Varanus komodoensis]KAF7248119.1 Cyclin-dependent kinase inhibitor 1B [Varanus komodoensis]